MAVALHLTINVENKLFIPNILENDYRFRYLIDNFIAIIYMRLWVSKRHFSTIFQLYGDGNDIKDMKMLFITIQTENLERNKNE